jgi:hypothetical protein
VASFRGCRDACPQNHDGFIDREELVTTMAALGAADCSPKDLDIVFKVTALSCLFHRRAVPRLCGVAAGAPPHSFHNSRRLMLVAARRRACVRFPRL